MKSNDGTVALKTWWRIACAVAVCLAAASSGYATPTTVLSIPADLTGDHAAIVQVPISAAPASGVLSIDMTVHYDPAVLQADSVAVSGIASAAGFGVASSVATPGSVVITLYATSGALSGSGEVARVQFHVLGTAGNISNLAIAGASVNEGQIPSSVQNGQLTVTPLPMALVLPNATGNTGSDVDVPLSVLRGDGALGISATIQFDPAVVTAQSVTVSGIALAAGFDVASNLTTPGVVRLSLYSAGDPLSGSGEIAKIRFHVAGPPSSATNLTFTAWSVNEGEISSIVDNGSFTINPVTALLYLPLDAIGATGSTVQVPVSVFPGDAICALDLTIQYDPAVIQAEDVTVSGIGAAAGLGLITNVSTPGIIYIAAYSNTVCMSGSGEFLRIQFHVSGAIGTTSPLTFTDASINEGHIPHTFHQGLFTVVTYCQTVPDGTVCNDLNPCTQTDACQGGVCVGTNPVSCPPADSCHVGVCDPSSGTCSQSPKPDGTACDDGTACTTGETCSGGVCGSGTPVVCNDNNPCTDDSCDPASGCVYVNNVSPCDDGNACTTGDTCGGGTCHPGTAVVCNDNNPCTDDSCDPSTGCVYTNNVSPCDDGNACTSGDTCGGGTCHPGTAVVCNDNNVCTTDTCDPSSGCVYTNNTDPCSDGNACTTGDTCGGGVCNPGTPVVCNDNNVCTTDSCNPSTGCVYTNNVNPCDDGNACTSSDTCSGGICAGTTIVCNDNNPCTDDSCDPSSGCVYTNNVSPCDDGNACTTGDTCGGGTCHGGAALVCNDNNPCTDDSCDPSSGCVYTNNVSPCDDGNACTTGDTCGGGTCNPGTPVVCNDNNVCTTDSCNPSTGCVYTNNTNPCDDGNACTFGDTCGGGTCHPGTPVVCNDNNVCTTDTCDPSSGCVYTNNTIACDDGNACTTGDTCGGGLCNPGSAVICNDSNPCTDDTCDPSTGCVYTNNTAPCDDANACTSNDTCGGGICAGTAIVCNDNNPCTDDSCDPSTGCVYTNNVSPCDDGNACTSSDTCSGGVCGGTTVVCNDNNVCTTDSCNPSTGCVYTNNTNPCSDGNACTTGDTCGGGVCNPGTPVVCNDNNVCTTDSCNPSTGCVYTNNTNPCSDGNACTTGDTCGGGVCNPGTPVVCNDNNVCTTDSCNPSTGCVYTNNTNPCDDGNACTTGDTCGGGICNPGTPVVCNDNNVCTTDSCNPSTGCVYTNNTNACDDGNACTTSDTCGGGTCHGGPALVCNDNNVCTTDTCNPSTGCVYTNNTIACSDGNACTTGDVCGGGTCHPGGATVCNDNNPCTTDSCNPVTGCHFTADDSNTCTDGDQCTTDTCSSGACIHTPSGLCTVSGVVRYYRDDLGAGSEPSTKGVSATGIDRTGDAVADATTDGSGAYGLGSLVGNVTVTTVSKYGSPRAADANGGITGLDASFVARGRVGLLTLSPNQTIAGDVTGDGTLSALDASEIARYAVQLVDHFDVAGTTGSDWKYLRCDNYAFPGNPGCVAPVYTYAPLTHAQPDTNFYAILYGDVTGNWRPTVSLNSSVARSGFALEEQKAAAVDQELAVKLAESAPVRIDRAAGSPPAELSIGGSAAPMRPGETRQLTINLGDAEGILGLDLTLRYDPTRTAVLNVTATGIASGYSVASASANGKTEIAAYGLFPLSGSGQTLTVTIQALKHGARGIPVTVTGNANEGKIPMHVRVSQGTGVSR